MKVLLDKKVTLSLTLRICEYLLSTVQSSTKIPRCPSSELRAGGGRTVVSPTPG